MWKTVDFIFSLLFNIIKNGDSVTFVLSEAFMIFKFHSQVESFIIFSNGSTALPLRRAFKTA
jgi:hypothetical protein